MTAATTPRQPSVRHLGTVRLDRRGRVYLRRLAEPAIAQGELWSVSVDNEQAPTQIVLDLVRPTRDLRIMEAWPASSAYAPEEE